MVALIEAVGGEALDTPFGPVWTVTHRQPLMETHGERPMGGFFQQVLDDVHRLTGDRRLEGRVADEALFVDIEATGLKHGAGTLAFLVGVAFREGDELITRQYLMREPSEERALCHRLLADLDAHPMLVTFNGKSYDLTVLEARMVMCRFLDRDASRLKLRPHLDLLHLARNLHRGRWPDTRLATLERQLLDFHRVDDLPGELVPSAWFHFLRTGDAGPLGRAVEHNLHDVRSMIVLADHLLDDAAPMARLRRPPRVTANLGRLLLRRGEPEEALAILSSFVDATYLAPEIRAEGLETLSIAARRARRTHLELGALQALRTLAPGDVTVLRRLSITLERRVRDVRAALAVAREAERVLPSPDTAARVKRLSARLERVSDTRG
ncbi:MAG: ribonuclease H-like domain-containing protein [Myxococcota bacterium]|nr:ribonuclease H-like domain-containing protein [Myxococcota bacterium]